LQKVSLNTAALPTGSLTDIVFQVGNADGTITRLLIDAFASNPNLTFRRANNTAASPSAVASGEQVGAFACMGWDSGGAYTTTSKASMVMTADENWTSTAHGTKIQFYVTLAGQANQSEALRISSAANLLVGTTTDGLTASGSLAISQDLAHRGSKLGTFNTAPTTKQTVTGAKGSNAALGSLLAALAAYGLITDSTSA
jgi:hypothetical protein